MLLTFLWRAGLSTIVGLALAGCQTPASMSSQETQVRGALQAWVEAFNECSARKAAALYAPDAVLWGTVSPVLISSNEGVRAYFERACATTPPPKVVLGESIVRTQDGESATASGTYIFTLSVQGQLRTLPARFSFAYRKGAEGWAITSHHSSLMPAVPAAASAPSR